MNTNSNLSAIGAPVARLASRLQLARLTARRMSAPATQPSLSSIRQQAINGYEAETRVWLMLAACGLGILALSLWG